MQSSVQYSVLKEHWHEVIINEVHCETVLIWPQNIRITMYLDMV